MKFFKENLIGLFFNVIRHFRLYTYNSIKVLNIILNICYHRYFKDYRQYNKYRKILFYSRNYKASAHITSSIIAHLFLL